MLQEKIMHTPTNTPTIFSINSDNVTLLDGDFQDSLIHITIVLTD